MSFQIHALTAAQFEPLFAMSDDELGKVRAKRMVVDAKPGYPCRVSLADAEIGETVILLNYEHQSGDSPFRSSHAIFVREHAEQASVDIDVVPAVLSGRIMSLRAFNDRHYLVDADVVEGSCLSESIQAMFQDPEVSYVDLHNAKPGCFAARATRV